MGRFTYVIAVAAVLLAAGTADAQTMLGAGAQSCGTWTHDRQSHMDLGVTSWVSGYLSGINTLAPSLFIGRRAPDLLQDLDNNAFQSWMDNYCQQHPLEKIYIAADLLSAELVKRKGSQ